MKLVWSRFAWSDRDDIFSYIEAESPRAAVKIDNVARCVRFACLELGEIDLRHGADHGKKRLFSCCPQYGKRISFDQCQALSFVFAMECMCQHR